jgi:hypothetical protein
MFNVLGLTVADSWPQSINARSFPLLSIKLIGIINGRVESLEKMVSLFSRLNPQTPCFTDLTSKLDQFNRNGSDHQSNRRVEFHSYHPRYDIFAASKYSLHLILNSR